MPCLPGRFRVSCRASPGRSGPRQIPVMLLGIVALRTGQGRKIEYDGENMRVTNLEEANQYLTRD